MRWNLTTAFLVIFTVSLCRSTDEDGGFVDWFTTEKAEVSAEQLTVTGLIPSYVQGLFSESGPAQFEMGEVHFGHALDGFAKGITFDIDGSRVNFSTSFLQSGFYKDSIKEQKIAPGMTAAETIPSTRKELGPMNALLGKNDNNYIKPNKIGQQQIFTSDTMYLTLMEDNFSNISETIVAMKSPLTPKAITWSDHIAPMSSGSLCMQANMAHGIPGSTPDGQGSYTVAMGCQTMNMGPLFTHHYILFRLDESNVTNRVLLAKVAIPDHRRPSYMHQNAVTDNNYVIIGVPMYMDMLKVMKGEGLAQGALAISTTDETIFQIINRTDGSYRNARTPGFLMGHVINAWEEGNDVLMDLTWYSTQSGGFFARYLLDIVQNKTARDSFQKGSVKRFRIKPDNSVETSFVSDPDIDIELPTMNPNYEGRRYCIVWAAQFGTGGRSYASIGIIKLNVCNGEKLVSYEKGSYPSEHRFVPRPGATEEDDGVLLGLVFNGTTKLSTLQVLDAKTMTKLAGVPTGLKIPFPIHTTWFGAT